MISILGIKLRLPRFSIAIQFTREGLIFIFLSLAIGAAAVNTGNNVLYFIFSLMLGMIILSGMTSRRILQGLRPEVEFPSHFFAGVPNVCYVLVRNRKKQLPSLAIRFVIRDPDFTSVSKSFFFIRPRSQSGGYASVVFARRGVYHLRQMELQTQAPFSFFIKSRRYSADQTVRVYPKVYRLSEELISRFSDGLFQESPYRGESQQLLHLRDYMPLDSSKRIHWKASAKAEKILVKEYQKEQGRDLYFYFDCFAEKSAHETTEIAISFLASIALYFKEREMNATVILQGKTFFPKDSLQSLLLYLSDWDALFQENSHIPPPPDQQVVSLCLQSKKIKSHLSIPGSRTLFIEDWQHLMTEDDAVQI